MSEMIDTELDTFFPLLHAMVRPTPATDEDNTRTREVVQWAAGHRSGISAVLDRDERKLVEHAVVHWSLYKEAPSRRTLEELIRQDDLPEAQLALLGDYDKWQPQLEATDAIEMENLFRARILSWTRLKFLFVTQQARIIAETGQASGNFKDPMRKGVPDAIKYLLGELHSGDFNPGAALTGGPMRKLADQVVPLYGENAAAANSNKHIIPTGIKVVDELIGGYDRKTLNLILGTIGQRKSAVARTIAYHAADKGFRTLFICLEWPYEEEIQIFSMMHSHALTFEGTESLSIKRFRNGTLLPKEVEFLSGCLVPSIKEDIGTNLVIRGIEDRTWANVRSVIEAENANAPLDMVVIDYITLLEVGAVRDPTYATNQLIREIKHMALYSNEGRGLVFVSPVQGNRKGYETAFANDGAWQATDISMYSEFEKSADTVMFCFMPPELSLLNQMKIGFCKARRFGIVAPRLVDVDPNVALVGGSPQTKEREALEANQARRSTLKDPTMYYAHTDRDLMAEAAKAKPT
jgi:hypothetical protein